MRGERRGGEKAGCIIGEREGEEERREKAGCIIGERGEEGGE